MKVGVGESLMPGLQSLRRAAQTFKGAFSSPAWRSRSYERGEDVRESQAARAENKSEESLYGFAALVTDKG